MTFGEKILMLRKEKGMSQEDLASKLGVSRQAISRWELEGVLPDASNVLELSKLFEVSTDYLLRDEIEGKNNVQAVNDTIAQSNKVDKEKNAMIGFIVIVSLHMLAFLISLYGFIEQIDFVLLAALPIHLVLIISFEMAFSWYKKRGVEEVNPRLHVYYRMIAVWIVSYFPIWEVVTIFFQYYPRPYFKVIPELLSVLLYLIVCVSITKILKKKLNSQNSLR